MAHSILVVAPPPNEAWPLLDEFTLHIWSDNLPDQTLLRRVEGILTYAHQRIDGTLMDMMPTLKIISACGVGVNHIDLRAARQRSIAVGNTPKLLDGASADMTFALLLAAARHVVPSDRYARSEAFTHCDSRLFYGQEVHGSTLGIIGLGNIGCAVARRAKGFDMQVIYHSRRPNPEAKSLGAKYVSLPDLLHRSDFVTLHVPLSRKTQGMIGRDQLKRMKPSAILVNMARGPVVDHDALVEAMNNKWIGAAALDVTEPEPLPRNHPLLKMENAVITPHLGSATFRTRQAMSELAIVNLKAGLEGRALPSPVVSEV